MSKHGIAKQPSTLAAMNLARSLERRIELIIDGLGAKVFRGRIHPMEVATRIVREAELNLEQGGVGPTAPNRFTVSLHPDDLGEDRDKVVDRLSEVVLEASFERGWRLPGPPHVLLSGDPQVTSGAMRVQAEREAGELPAWATLIETRGNRRLAVRYNRSLVGRSRQADVTLGDDEVSRSHALLWRDAGGAWVQDLASSNGTTVNGAAIHEPSAIQDGDMVGFGAARFNFRL